MWSLYPPFDLLATFALPQPHHPTSLAVDPLERYVYGGTDKGHAFRVPLYRHTADDPTNRHFVEAVGGGGPGAAPIKLEGSVIALATPITALALSATASHLLIGTSAADIHVYALPSHQHIRTLSSHAGAISHLSTMLRPPDLVGTPQSSVWPLMEIRPFERTKAGARIKEAHDVGIVLQANAHTALLDELRLPGRRRLANLGTSAPTGEADRLAELEAENQKLRLSLERALKINDQMWNGLVDRKIAQVEANGDT